MRRLWSALLACLLAAPALAQEPLRSDTVKTENVEARLVLEAPGVTPGGTVTVALRQKIREGWHTYWINPGDSGEPTIVEWTLPPGWTAGPLEFPYPERIPVGPLMNFGFSGAPMFLAQVTAPPGAKPGDMAILRADATWLVCEEICIPEEGAFEIGVPVVAEAPAPNGLFAGEFAAARAKLPQPSPWSVGFAAADGRLTLAVDSADLAAAGVESAAFFPNEGGYIKNPAPQTIAARDGKLVLETASGRRLAKPEDVAKVASIPGLLVLTDAGGETRAFAVDAKPDAGVRAFAAAPAAASTGGGGDGLSLGSALGFAFLGGLILNLMPCVFPVLSMKALALAQKGGDQRKARLGGLAYTAGVLACFVGLAGLMLALRAQGEAIGWGFQLQSPEIVAPLAVLFFALGLNLMGVFELGLGLQNAGAVQGPRHPIANAFATGLLAAIVATPCTAPFMGAAMGWAIVQPAAVALAVFAALGFGMAFPYLALTFWPALVRALPKPGAWMERFKQLLAFPMFASAIWLVWVVAVQASPMALIYVLSAMLLVAFAGWAWGLVQRGEWGWTGRGAALAGLAAGIAALVLLPQGAGPAQAEAARAGGETSGPVSEAYAPARLDALLAEGKPVFVNLTAAWCVTCLVNEEVALSSARIADAFKAKGIAYLKGDWTKRDPEITKLLEAHGRAGVPLYLYYPPGAKTPAVLPQILTESIVLDAIGAGTELAGG